MQRRDWTLLLILAALWGSSYLFIKVGLRDLSPPMVVFGRVLFGALVLVPLAWRAGALRGLGGLWPMLTLVALVQVAAPFLLIAEGEQHIDSSLAGILVASVPIFSALLAIAYDPEDRSDGLRGVGILLGIVGVALLLGLDLEGGDALLGGLAILLASLGYAVGALLVKKRLSGMQPIGIAAAVMVISALLSTPAAAATLPSQAPGIGPLAAVAALGVLGTGIAFAIFYGLIARAGPSRTFVVTYLAPGFAVVYGALFLDEAIALATIAGLALILAGSWLAAEGRLPGRRRAGEPAELCDADPVAGGLDPRLAPGQRSPGAGTEPVRDR